MARHVSLTSAQTAAALRTVLRILENWDVSEQQSAALLGTDEFLAWRANPIDVKPTDEQVERLSLLLGIYRAIRTRLPDARAADSWVKRPNASSLCGGSAPIDVMTGDLEGLRTIHAWLLAEII